MAKYHADVQAFVDVFHQTAPYGDLWCGINIHRIDVVSTDSGADDPVTCGDGSAGSGAIAHTYFDATFCSGNLIRRLLTCDSVSARNVAHALVPATHVTMVIVNSPLYGGSGGDVATFSTAPGAAEIALHEMGHTARLRRRVRMPVARAARLYDVRRRWPVEPNVTRNTDRASIKWRSVLSSATDALDDCPRQLRPCDPQPNLRAADYVGAYEGARYMHCGAPAVVLLPDAHAGPTVLRHVPEGHAGAVPGRRIPRPLVEPSGGLKSVRGWYRAPGGIILRPVRAGNGKAWWLGQRLS
jgi:hypothetical protein